MKKQTKKTTNKSTNKMKASSKAAPKSKQQRQVASKLTAKLVEGPIPYLEATVQARVTEETMVSIFERVRDEISRHQVKRVLVDLREGSVDLTISDMLGLAKLVTAALAGILERLSFVVRPQDLLSEKFFEPSVSSRGLPTFVTTDPKEAIYWVTAKLRRGR